MLAIPDALFEREDEIEKWKSIGIPPRMIIDKPYLQFVLDTGSIITGWLIARKAKGMKYAAIADRLNAERITPHPAFNWDATSVQALMEAERSIRGRPPPKLKQPRSIRRAQCRRREAMLRLRVEAMILNRRIRRAAQQRQALEEIRALRGVYFPKT